jgi:mRNA interferase MazF
MSNDVNQGDVWLANVFFRDSSEYKQRPVVIVGNELALDIDVLIAPVTSQLPRGPFDIVLEHWQESGLKKPSLARTNKIASFTRSELKRKLGVLHEHDLERVLASCRRLF